MKLEIPFRAASCARFFFVGLACLRKSWTWAKWRVKRQIKSKAAHSEISANDRHKSSNDVVFSKKWPMTN